jgi:hypothetical protein
MIAAPHRVGFLVIGCFFSTLVGTALAQYERDVDTQQHNVLAEAFVNEKLAVWQRNLSLDDWNISIVMCRRSDLKFKTLGGVRWDKTKRSAVISVLAPSEYQLTVNEMLDDMELTIVHELIHVHLAALPRSEASRRDEERAVNQLARALLKLDRKIDVRREASIANP